MTMNVIAAFSFILIALAMGDLVSTRTKAFVPSVFVTAILFILGFWTFFPKDIVDISSLGMPAAQLAMYLLITHMGTMMSIKELAKQWKTIVIALGGIIGVVVAVMTVGSLLFGIETAIIAAPPLTGGLVSSIMMSEAAMAAGLTELSVLAILVYVAQGFAGYPLTAIMLKKEGTRLLEDFRNGNYVAKTAEEEIAESTSKFKIIPDVPEKYNTTYVILMKLGIVAWGAVSFSTLINDVVSPYVVCLIFGVIAAEIGLVDRKPLDKAGSFGWLMTLLMAFIFAGLSNATPALMAKMAFPLISMIIIGVIGMSIVCFILSKVLKVSFPMSYAISLTSLYGFPPNFILTDEAAKALAETPEEKKYLMDEMLPPMIVGGFTTVTVGSVLIAGFFVNLL